MVKREDDQEITLVCKYHSGNTAEHQEFDRRLGELKQTDNEQWGEIGRKASSKMILWGMGVLLVILGSLFGVMYNKLESNQKSLHRFELKLSQQLGLNPEKNGE